MWIRVALNKKDVHYNGIPNYTYAEGDSVQEYYFDENVAVALEKDGFLFEMWSKFDALFDWGDCDYFSPKKCIDFKIWLENRLHFPTNDLVKQIYEVMLEMANIAIKYDIGLSFDFWNN